MNDYKLAIQVADENQLREICAALMAERDAAVVEVERLTSNLASKTEIANQLKDQLAESFEKRMELAAQVEVLRVAGSKALEYLIYPAKRSSGASDSYEKLSEAIAATQQQHLRELRAEAVLEFVSSLPSIAYMKKELLIEANQYADRILQGSAE